MNIFNFTEQKDNDKEYKYKVLVYPNITYMRDLEKDSYVVVLRNVIKELNKVRDDIHWTILSPTEVKSLVFPNTTQLPINLPSYPNAMRRHFNHKELYENVIKHDKWMITYNDCDYIRLLYKDYQLKPIRTEKVSSRRQLSPEDYIKLLKDTGFKVEYVNATSYNVPVDGFHYISEFKDWIEGILPGVPLECGKKTLQKSLRQIFKEITHFAPKNISDFEFLDFEIFERRAQFKIF